MGNSKWGNKARGLGTHAGHAEPAGAEGNKQMYSNQATPRTTADPVPPAASRPCTARCNEQSRYFRLSVILTGILCLVWAFNSAPPAASAEDRLPQVVAGEMAFAPPWVRRGCAALWSDAAANLHCGIGSASGSRNRALMISAAEGRGRTAIARGLRTRVQTLLRDYQATTTGGDEFGHVAADEQHVVDVGRQLTEMTLAGTTRRDLWLSPGGITYALMVLELDGPAVRIAIGTLPNLAPSLKSHLEREAPSALGRSATEHPVGRDSLILVTQDEIDALFGGDTPVAWGRDRPNVDGPVIHIDSPKEDGVYHGPFPIHVRFEVGTSGRPVDMSSLKLEYKVAWGIDITDRVRDYIRGSQIDVEASELPSGKHTVEIQIADVDGHRSTRRFTVTVL